MADKREVLLDLLARDKTGPATKSAADNLDDVADAAKDADEQVSKLGKSSRTAAEHVEKLDDEIAKTEQHLVDLAAALAETDDKASRLDISRSIRQAEGDLRRLSKSKGILAALIPDEVPPAETRSLAGKIAGSLTSSLGSVARGIGDQIGPKIGVAAGAAAAPILIGTIGGAISAGAGAAGIGAGIALAVKNDPELQGLGKAIGQRLFGELEDAASQSLSGPIRESLHTLAGYGDEIVEDWGGAFAKLAPYVEPFIDDIGRGISSLSESLANIAGESGPVLESLGEGFARLADAIGYSLETITADAEGSAEALDVVFGFLSEETKSLADSFSGAGQTIKEELEIWGIWDDLVERYGKSTKVGIKVTRDLSESHKEAADAANGQREALEALSTKLKAEVDPVFGLLDAQDKLAAAQKNVADATKKHGRNSDEAKAALRQLAEAALTMEGQAGKLGGAFDGKMTPALRATLQAAGLTKGQIAQLEKQFREAKKDGDRFAKKYEAKAAVAGVPGAKKHIQSLIELAKQYDGVWTATMITSYKTYGKPYSSPAPKSPGGLAAGGEVTGSGPKGIDSELRLLAPGEHVWTAAEVDAIGGHRMMKQLRAQARGGGAGMADLIKTIPRPKPSFGGGGSWGGGSAERIEITVRFDFGPSELGRVLANAVRTQPAVAATLAQHLRVRVTT